MAAFWKKKQFWGALIGLVLLAYCLKDIRPSEIRVLLQRVNIFYMLLCILSCFIFIVLKGLRWRLLVAQQKKMPVVRSITLFSAGQVLSVIMPALTGQVGRLFLFSSKEGLRKTFVFSTLVMEVLFDAISLVVFMFLTSLAFVFPQEYRYLSFVVAGVTVAVLILFYLILHYQQQTEDLGRRLLRERYPGVYITVKKFLRSFTKGIEMLRSTQHIFGTLAYSLLSWTAHMFVVWFLIRSFGLDLPFAAAAVVMIINTIVLMLPITPGNAGTFEFAVSSSLAAFSVGRSDAVLFALALHVVDLLPVFTFGFYFLRLEKMSLRKIKEEHEEEIILDKIDEEGAFIEEDEVA
ncbi:MAG: hypothetical protein DRP45_07445 [Candidatus Zixiibacteriota bacterium]|nr:MAG: hypothetical protein DRP45_07445 [candidate division Zixibacteria bacterium]